MKLAHYFEYKKVVKSYFMKTIYERICAVKDVYSEHFSEGLSILLVLFFVVFGAISLYVLINSPV